MTEGTTIPVILAGGSGTRLWPVSRESLPKQFARIMEGHTLFQQTVLRAKEMRATAAPIVITNKRYLSIVAGQLAEIGCEDARIICEPAGRDTAAAVALACELLLPEKSDAMIVLPSDHAIGDTHTFGRAIASGLHIARRNGCIVTLGIRPAHPETGYGYIRAGAPIHGEPGYLLDSFIEKPNAQTAEELVRTPGVYWNAGIFLFRKDLVRNEFLSLAPVLLDQVRRSVSEGEWKGNCFHPAAAAFEAISPVSFDYAIMEKTAFAAVVPTDPSWSDLGSWKSVWENSAQDASGNVTAGRSYCVNTSNSFAISDGPVIGVAGLDDIVVVANRDAILVTSRSNPQDVKKLVEEMRNDGITAAFAHSGETRPWGRFESLDRGASHQVKRITVNPGGRLSLQYHHHRAEHWVVVSGLATVTVDTQVMLLGPCQQVFIPQGAVHRLENLGDEPIEMIEVQYGHYLGEDDIVRVEDVYGRDATETPSFSVKAA